MESAMCKMCHERGESISHVISECTKLAQKEYKKRHDNVARMIHGELCGVNGLDSADKWYEHQPQSVLEMDKIKVLRDLTYYATTYRGLNTGYCNSGEWGQSL